MPRRTQKPLRLTDEQLVRLARAAKFKAETEQTLMLRAVMKEIEALEAEAEASKDKRAAAAARKLTGPVKSWRGPGPVGLGPNLQDFQEAHDPAKSRQETSPATSANATATSPETSSETSSETSTTLVSGLADYIVRGGPAFARASRERAVSEILKAAIRDEGSREAASRRVSEVVRAESGDGVVRATLHTLAKIFE